MQICKNCKILMSEVLSFSKDKHEKFERCPKCKSETKHKTLRNDELNFNKILQRKISNTE